MRPFARAVVDPDPDGVTVLTGPNGTGKTTVLEAVAYLGSQRSFRTSSRDAMVRAGAARAIVRATCTREGHPLLVESELSSSGSARTLLNRQAVRARSALARALPVSVFSPDDLGIVQGPPARRREVLDATLRILDSTAAHALDDLDRVLRQRAALLRQAGGRLSTEIATTLDVWDDRLATSGETVAVARATLVEALGPYVAEAYAEIAADSARAARDGAGLSASPGAGNLATGNLATGNLATGNRDPGDAETGGPRRPDEGFTITYRRSWRGTLAEALVASRKDDVRRGVSTVGPQRDDLTLALGPRDARLAASQGEQRTLALSLRLGVHRLVTERTGAAPLLLLDDVFSELDPARSRALVRHLPSGQALLTTAGHLPEGVEIAAQLDVRTLGDRP